jgi:hypothetical protein
MTHLSLEMIRAIQNDYERKAARIRLINLARTSQRTSPFTKKLEGLARDITHLVLRLVSRQRRPV